MLAMVIDITDETVYLEIENQLRFHSPYERNQICSDLLPQDKVWVEFDSLNCDHVVSISRFDKQ